MMKIRRFPKVVLSISIFMQLTVLGATGQERIEDLIVAIEKGNHEKAKTLLASGIEVKNLGTPLVLAVKYGRLEIVKELLKARADVNARDLSNSATALMWASIVDPGKEAKRKGIPVPSLETKLEIVRELLEFGADVNAANAWGGTALQWAADDGRVEVVNVLINAGADVNAGDQDGLTPLMAAANYESSGHQKIVKQLLDAKAVIARKNNNGDTALTYAVNNFRTENVDILIRAGADLNTRNNLGFTPLMRAAQLSRTEIMKVLIANGADLNARTNEGESVLSVARRAGYQEAIQLLLQSGAK